MAVGPDGTLYAGSKGVTLAIDPETLIPVAAWGNRAGRGNIDFLGPPTGHLEEYPVGCAC